jgi:hypothetical protein
VDVTKPTFCGVSVIYNADDGIRVQGFLDKAYVDVLLWYICIQSVHIGMCGRYIPMNAAVIEDAYPYERLLSATTKKKGRRVCASIAACM